MRPTQATSRALKENVVPAKRNHRTKIQSMERQMGRSTSPCSATRAEMHRAAFECKGSGGIASLDGACMIREKVGSEISIQLDDGYRTDVQAGRVALRAF